MEIEPGQGKHGGEQPGREGGFVGGVSARDRQLAAPRLFF